MAVIKEPVVITHVGYKTIGRMGKSHLQGHQRALLNFGPSSYTSYNSYAWGSKVIFFI